jgi:hypothetical protein
MLDQYLQYACLSPPGDPCCDCACVEMERNDHCGQVMDCVFFCVCEDDWETCHADG